MENVAILPILVVVTLLAVVLFAMRSKQQAESKKQDPNANKSTLAADAQDHKAKPPET